MYSKNKNNDNSINTNNSNTNNSNSNNSNSNNTNNIGNDNRTININYYSNTNDDHITEDKIREFIMNDASSAITQLLKHRHLNPDKPENMNILLSNLKSDSVKMYENDI